MEHLCGVLQALQSIIEHQQVEYDFGYYKLSQHTDCPVTILSEGKTLLQTNVGLEVPLQPTSEFCESTLQTSSPRPPGRSCAGQTPTRHRHMKTHPCSFSSCRKIVPFSE